MQHPRSRSGVALFLVAGAVALAACGGSDDDAQGEDSGGATHADGSVEGSTAPSGHDASASDDARTNGADDARTNGADDADVDATVADDADVDATVADDASDGAVEAGDDDGATDAGDDGGATDAGDDGGATDAGDDGGATDAGDDGGATDAGDATVDASTDAGVDSGADAGDGGDAGDGSVTFVAPDAPTSVAATAGDRSATITWTPGNPRGGAIVSYQFFDGGTQIASCVIGTTCTSPTSFVVTGLTNGTHYSFTIKESTDAPMNNQSAASVPAVGVTPAGTPAAPTSVAATAGDGSATITWTAGNPNGGAIVSYQFFDGGTQIASCVVGTTCTSPTSFVLTGLTNGTHYSFTIKESTNAATNNQSAASTPAAGVTPAGLPGTPTLTGITPGAGNLTIVWNAPANNGSTIDSYEVELFLASNGAFVTSATSTTTSKVMSATACAYTVSGSSGSASCTATTGRAFRAVVAAHNGSNVNGGNGVGWSSFSVAMNGTPKVGYAADNVGAIFNTYLSPSSATCNACHSYNATSAAAEGASIYQCPAATNASQCSGIFNMCSGQACITNGGAEWDVLSLWIAGGGLQ